MRDPLGILFEHPDCMKGPNTTGSGGFLLLLKSDKRDSAGRQGWDLFITDEKTEGHIAQQIYQRRRAMSGKKRKGPSSKRYNPKPGERKGFGLPPDPTPPIRELRAAGGLAKPKVKFTNNKEQAGGAVDLKKAVEEIPWDL